MVATWLGITILSLGLLAFCMPAHAKSDHPSLDILNSYPAFDYCMLTTRMYDEGAQSQKEGFERKIVDVTAADDEYITHHQPLPSKVLRYRGWDTMAAGDREFMSAIVLAGYDWAKELSIEGYGGLERGVQGYFEKCIRERSKPKTPENEVKGDGTSKPAVFQRISPLIKVASSAAIVPKVQRYDPRGEANFCANLGDVAEAVFYYKITGVEKEVMLAEYGIPDHWSVDFQAFMSAVVDGIYDWEGDASEYLSALIATCEKGYEQTK